MRADVDQRAATARASALDEERNRRGGHFARPIAATTKRGSAQDSSIKSPVSILITRPSTDVGKTTAPPLRIGDVEPRSSRHPAAQGVFVSFIVTARQSAREVRFERTSMLAALEQALTLASSGMQGVLISDSSGRSHTPAEFGRALLHAPTGFEAARAVPRAA